MAYNITVESCFSAAHRLKGYRGKCENIHGHNWKVAVTIESSRLDKIGMVFDFKGAKSILDKILYSLDHKKLSDLSYFKKRNPTSELIAEFIFNQFKKRLKPEFNLKGVSVWETPTSCAAYSEEY